MNNKRRKEIHDVITKLDLIKSDLERILDDEQMSYDNIPENLLGGERAEISEEAIEILEEVIDRLEEI